MSARLKKLTIQVPEDLLARAAAASGEGVAPTIRRSLELMAAGAAYATSCAGCVEKLDLASS